MLYELITGKSLSFEAYCKRKKLKGGSESLEKFKKSVLFKICGNEKLSTKSVKEFFEKTFFVDEENMWNMDDVVNSDFYKELRGGLAQKYFS